MLGVGFSSSTDEDVCICENKFMVESGVASHVQYFSRRYCVYTEEPNHEEALNTWSPFTQFTQPSTLALE